MSSCLGIYIENNLIKYAKISKERETIKIEAFGVRFYDELEKTIKQIINETYSFKIPISINLGEENYAYSQIFSLLNKNDIEKSADTEFEFFCNEKGKNKNALQYRKKFLKNVDNGDKLTVLYAYTDKTNIVSKLQAFDGSMISGIYPEPVSIVSLKRASEVENSIIINIEKETTITTTANGEVYKIDVLQDGMKQILDTINEKENSYNKAYEICKNTTLYTSEGLELQTDDMSEYIEDIVPTLYNIIQGTKEVIAKNGINVQNIYITGMAAIINNIDLYFQESFNSVKCEILKPFFLENVNLKVNIKDYIEVNSAIALALTALGPRNKEMNFKNESVFEKITKKMKVQLKLSGKKIKNERSAEKNNKKEKVNKLANIKNINLSGPINIINQNLIRAIVLFTIIIVVYLVLSSIALKMIANKNDEINSVKSDTNSKIEEIGNASKIVDSRNSDYEKIFERLKQNNEKIAQISARKKSIPTFLRELMTVVPEKLQILAITNTTDKHMKIEVQSQKYEYLGYLTSAVKNEGILNNVTSTTGKKQGDLIYIVIEGDLPY